MKVPTFLKRKRNLAVLAGAFIIFAYFYPSSTTMTINYLANLVLSFLLVVVASAFLYIAIRGSTR